MSNQSNNNRFNQNRDYSLYSASNTENNTTKDTFLKNGSNIIKNDYNNNFSSPNTRRDTEGVSPYVLDAKIKDLESKLSTLEETNQILLERINTNERNFQIQLKQLQVNNLEERENRYKAEKVINNQTISDETLRLGFQNANYPISDKEFSVVMTHFDPINKSKVSVENLKHEISKYEPKYFTQSYQKIDPDEIETKLKNFSKQVLY